jgi:hypothetical protein
MADKIKKEEPTWRISRKNGFAGELLLGLGGRFGFYERTCWETFFGQRGPQGMPWAKAEVAFNLGRRLCQSRRVL